MQTQRAAHHSLGLLEVLTGSPECWELVCGPNHSVVSDSATLWTSSPGSSVHGSLQARILEWVAIPYSRGSSQPRDRAHVSCISCIGRCVLYHCTTWGAAGSQGHLLFKGHELTAGRQAPCRLSPCLCQVRGGEALCQAGLEAQAACLGVLVSFPGHVTGPLGQGAAEAPGASGRPEIL